MKLDDEVKMISAEAPIIFAKAAEMFIQEVTIRAWLHTEENKRRTLQVMHFFFFKKLTFLNVFVICGLNKLFH